jgi:hypothetical protein
MHGGGGGGAGTAKPPAGTGQSATTGVSAALDSAIHQSALMSGELQNIHDWGYHIQADTRGYTDYTTHTIHVDTSLSIANQLGSLSHEFGHVMYEHYYGLPQPTLSEANYVSGWMENEGYAQVNTMRVAQDMPSIVDMHLQGSSMGQIQAEYTAYDHAQARYFNDPGFASQVDFLKWSGYTVGQSMTNEIAVKNADGTTQTYTQIYSNGWQLNHPR